MGTTIGASRFMDQDYADDAALFTDKSEKWPLILSNFDDAAQTMGLHTSWTKTKLQNIGYRPQPSPVDMQGNTVEPTDCFTYLGSQIHSSGHSTTEIFRRIGIASSVMGRLTNVWRQSRLSLSTKMRLYNALVKSVLLYGAETWTMLKSDEQKLEAFHMSCQRHILGIRWYDFITNVEVVARTQQENLAAQIQRRRLAVFGHVRRLPDTVQAHTALRLSIDARSGRRVDGRLQWKRPRGRPRNTWVRQVELDIGMTADTAWNIAAERDEWRALRPTAGHAVQ
jgi:hypothetical protein